MIYNFKRKERSNNYQINIEATNLRAAVIKYFGVEDTFDDNKFKELKITKER